MSTRPSERSIFLDAIEKQTPEELARFLEDACAGEPGLRRKVEALLQAHQQSGDLLDAGEHSEPTANIPNRIKQPSEQIGPYKVLQEVGEGGMGVVYMAEQKEPIRRRVALKIIKPGMDSRQVVARFEAERQALAMMDHPNIAKVFEAGTTESGRPYFAMELVKGVPITDYCDENH